MDALTEELARTGKLVHVMVRVDEAAYLTGHDDPNTKDEYQSGARCKCGHLFALHNTHCCTFCMVPGCDCDDY